MNPSTERPYIGPRTFEENERDRFFGRDREARELLALVVSQQLVLFYAQSGAGKSSLVNTRLIPDLKSKGFEVVQGRVAGDAPAGIAIDNIYVYNLTRSLTKDATVRGALSDLLSAEAFERRKNQAQPEGGLQDARHGTKRYALIIDQFEELFHTHPEAWQKREGFFQQLAQVMEDNQSLWVILTMREDFVAALDPYAYLLPGKLRMRYYMQRLEREAALEAIKKPVKDLRPYAPGVAEELVDDLSRVKIYKPDGSSDFQLGQYVEPVQLQVVCYGLWEKLKLKPGPQITREDVQEHVRDVDQSLEEHFARRVAEVAKAKNVSERAIRDWFGTKLISASGVRNMVLRETGEKEGALQDDVIQALQSDLVRAEMRGGATFYELTHDRLVEPILENNRQWNAENSSPFRLQAEAWAASGDKIHLLSDTGLEKAEKWAEENLSKLTETDAKFLAACRLNQKEKDDEWQRVRQREKEEQELAAQQLRLEAAEKLANEQARSARLSKRFTAVAIFLLVLALVAAGVALNQRATAVAQQATAVAAKDEAVQQALLTSSNEIAVKSQSVLDTNRPLGLLLAIEALDKAQQAKMPQLAVADGVLREAAKLTGGILLSGGDKHVNVIAFSPDGHWLASGGDDDYVQLWNVMPQNPQTAPIMLSGHTGPIYALAFSPGSRWLASASDDGTVRLWDMTAEDQGAKPVVLNGRSGPIWRLAFSPDGHWLATGNSSGLIRLWDMTVDNKAASNVSLHGHTGPIYALAFSRDNHWLASASDDKTARLWDMSAKDPSTNPIVLTGHTGAVYWLAFSPNGHWLATAGADGSVRLWDMTAEDKAAQPIELKVNGHRGYIWRLGFSPNGHWLAAGSEDSTVLAWDMTGEDLATANPIELTQHIGAIYALAFSPDSKWLTSGSTDNSIRIWNLAAKDMAANPIVLRAHTGAVDALAFSQDQRWLASAGYDGAVRIWNTHTEIETETSIAQYVAVGELAMGTNGVTNLSFSPPVSQSGAGTSQVKNLSSGTASGLWLAGAHKGDDTQLWDFQAGIPVELPVTLHAPADSLVYDPKTLTLYTGSENEIIYSWPLGIDNPEKTEIDFPGHQIDLSKLAYCSDSKCWASTHGNDMALYLPQEEISVCKSISLTRKPNAEVRSLVISPGNGWLASGYSDSMIYLLPMGNLYDRVSTSCADVSLRATAAPLSFDLTSLDASVLVQNSPVHFLTFSSDGRWLASGGEDGAISIWDISGGAIPRKASYTLTGGASPVYALAFSPGSRWLASGNGDANIRLWDMSSLSSAPIVLKSDEAAIFALTFSPDGRWLASGGPDNKVQLWGSSTSQLREEVCRAVGRNLEWQEWKSVFHDADYHVTCPKNPFPASVADHFLSAGDHLAALGDTEGAVAAYQQATVDCPVERCPGFQEKYLPSSYARANHKAAQALLDNGDASARKVEIDQAMSQYRAAVRLDPKIIPDGGSPELRAKRIGGSAAKRALLDDYYAGDYQQAVADFEIIQKLNPDLFTADDATRLNDLCWRGSTKGHAADVKAMCEEAAKLRPQDQAIIDSRGLNRALLGNYPAAIEDFQFSVDWIKKNGTDSSFFHDLILPEREAWIKALKAGQNPFDQKTLDHLYADE